MRTVSFSDPDVRNLLNQNFVNTYSDTTGDPTAGQSIWHAPDDPAGACIRGNGRQNVQTLFLTPEGEIIHAVTGYVSAEDLAGEIEFAQSLFDEIQEASDSPEAVVRRAHERRMTEWGFDEDEIANGRGLGAVLPILGGGDDLLKGMIERQVLADHRFSIEHPLMGYREFEKDPSTLVGKGGSFFSSKSNTTISEDKLRESIKLPALPGIDL